MAKGVVDGVFNALKAATYQLDSKDPLHKIELNKFYKDHKDLCAEDVSSKYSPDFLSQFIDGDKISVKIKEYGPEVMKKIRMQSGFSDDFLL